ncbi:MAG TPA: nucleotide exchange factor GrpE [Thermoanaerobaculia bacterium]|nr:nucleotide exchange factor GrpE [Thermoanaerobaculia bacterium]
MHFNPQEVIADEAREAPDTLLLEALGKELSLLRKAVLRQGHAQELFQARVEEAVAGLSGAAEKAVSPPSLPNSAQVRALLELDQSVLQLLRLSQTLTSQAVPAEGAAMGGPAENAPQSLREGLSLLQVRVRNLQHSLGLEAIPAQHRRFDDRWHEAYGVTHRPDLPDGWVVEEILPGYRLGERVVRPARVVVNRHDSRDDRDDRD